MLHCLWWLCERACNCSSPCALELQLKLPHATIRAQQTAADCPPDAIPLLLARSCTTPFNR